ncbi:MAG TPA: family 78 glycoside hydrolase catalytic domain [Chitinophagaceae bacterium]|nr:family 78 glycoside hydrolase catalytic domain [Chitinophagaceae bacterium]
MSADKVNRIYLNVGLFVSLLLLSLMLNAQSSIFPQQLRCEYLINPAGIDEPSPRLGWTLRSNDPTKFGQRQTAYKILVSHSVQKLGNNQGEVWNSGWVSSNEMQFILYKGKALLSDKNYYWKVSVKDEKGKESAWSDIAHWSTGILNRAEWTAKWIGTATILDTKQPECNIPDPWFRKTVELKSKPSKATLFVASVGYHELYVNGKKIGDDVLAPCVSDHSKRARYVTYDIAGELKAGKNVIALWLGVSWSIFASYTAEDKPRAPIVMAQADIYTTGNSTKPALRIQTDESWKTHPSPNKLLGIWDFNKMGGEIWDANKEIADWNGEGCNESTWQQATIYYPKLTLSSQMVEPNRLFNEIHPVAIEEKPDGSFRVDMGVNFAGWTEIKIKGEQGQRIDFLFSEREKEEMTFRNYSAYIIGESGEGVFHNKFNYSSGRWITIKGLKEKPALTDIRGWIVRTNYQLATTFECSDSLQNWIYDRVRWNFENLSLGGYVVDCPQRERMGYGGDAHATSETGLFNYKLGAFYTKWMEDWRDVQGTRSMDYRNYGGNADEGIVPHTAPTYWGGGGPAWGGIVVTLPWQMYLQEGDKRILEKNFELIKRWIAFLESHTKNGLLMRFGGEWDFLGDWLWPNATAEGMNNDKPENICFNNCYRVYNLRTAVKIARLLGKQEEALKWQQQAELSSDAIHAKYYNAADHSYADSSMGNLAAALLADVPPQQLRKVIMQRLEKEILVVRKGHIDVGITGGALLFKLLREEGRDDLLYSMTSQTDYPGWGYMKANGATTLWEMWEKDLPGHSLLHSSYLYPGAWYVDGIAGIRRDPNYPGFKKFIIRPPMLNQSKMQWAKASFDSPVGMIKSSWQRKEGKLRLEVNVPPNSKATIEFPAAKNTEINLSPSWAKKTGYENGYVLFELGPGTYTLTGKEN